MFSEQTATFSLYSTNSLVYITEAESVYSAVRNESLYKTQIRFVFKGLKNEQHTSCDRQKLDSSLSWNCFRNHRLATCKPCLNAAMCMKMSTAENIAQVLSSEMHLAFGSWIHACCYFGYSSRHDNETHSGGWRSKEHFPVAVQQEVPVVAGRSRQPEATRRGSRRRHLAAEPSSSSTRPRIQLPSCRTESKIMLKCACRGTGLNTRSYISRLV